MKYIESIMNSLSAITTSEAGRACLRISNAKTDEDRRRKLLRFSLDVSDLDNLLSKADEALQVLRENRPQFDYDHCEKTKQPRYVYEFADYLKNCSEIFVVLSEIIKTTSYAGAVKAQQSYEYARAFFTYCEYVSKFYTVPTGTSEKAEAKGGKKPQNFDSCILDVEMGDEIRRKIEIRIASRGKGGKQVATIIKAASALGWITKPNSAIMQREFGIKDVSGYNSYINETGGHSISDSEVEAEKEAVSKA